jgi:hypothetical protein
MKSPTRYRRCADERYPVTTVPGSDIVLLYQFLKNAAGFGGGVYA